MKGGNLNREFNVFRTNFLRYCENGQQAQINEMVINRDFISIAQYNHVRMVDLFWLYCCRNIYVNTNFPNYEQSTEYIRWQNLLEICGIQLPQNYDIVDPISIAICLLNVSLSQHSPSICAGGSLFIGLSGFLLVNGRLLGLPNLLKSALTYMLRTNIRNDFIQAIIINTNELERSELDFVSPELCVSIIKQSQHLYENGTITDIKAVRVILKTLFHNPTMLNEPETWNILDMFVKPVLAEGLIRQSYPDKWEPAIRIIKHYSMDVNMRIPPEYVVPPQIQNRYDSFSFLDVAIDNSAPQIALYLIKNGAEITESNVNSILTKRISNPALIKYLLTIGKISKNDIHRISNVPHPDNDESKHILNNWNQTMTSYLFEKTNPHLLTQGFEEFNDYE